MGGNGRFCHRPELRQGYFGLSELGAPIGTAGIKTNAEDAGVYGDVTSDQTPSKMFG